MRQSEKVLASLVDAWNQVVPEGAHAVVVRDDGTQLPTFTRSAAFIMGGHSAMVMVDGIAGAYAMERVIPVAQTP